MAAIKSLRKLSLFVTVSHLLYCLPLNAQTQPRPEAKDDVVRVYTELVQTDVMVFDKQGRFVNNLKAEDFELRIDGQLRPIEFFERIIAGSANEEIQLAAARGQGNLNPKGAPVPLDRGRTVFFYLDDLHLDLASTQLTRRMVSQFVDEDMQQNDQAAITSASGQIGFLQQLTDNKSVLRGALERLRPQSVSVKDFWRPPMTEYQAVLISRHDRDVLNYFIDAVLQENPGISRDIAESMVRNRAQQMLLQAANFTRATLSGLEGLIKSSSRLPGRKIVFFVSNGFFLDDRNSDSLERLQKITSGAARSGVVIYSMDARGLVTGMSDASTDVAFDVTGKLDRASHGELLASQDILNALARDTGGKPVFNTNSLAPAMKTALNEASTYYLLAWKPDSRTTTPAKFRKLEVKLAGRTDLIVRVRRGFYEVEPTEPRKETPVKTPEKSVERDLVAAITSVFPERELPVALNLAHVNMPERGDLLSVSLQVPSEFLTFKTDVGDKRKAIVEVGGFVHDSRGHIGAKFNQRLSVTANAGHSSAANGGEPVILDLDVGYTFPVFLKPGLYQARVGVVDVANGKTGSANAWIDIPDLSAKQLGMSSVLLGEREAVNIANASTASTEYAKQINLSIDRQFHQDAYLRFLVFIYNASLAPATGKPDAAIQIQVVRDDQPVLTTVLRRVDPEGVIDLARLPYAAELSLNSLPLGQYLMIVTAVDRISKRSVSQQTKFRIVQ